MLASAVALLGANTFTKHKTLFAAVVYRGKSLQLKVQPSSCAAPGTRGGREAQYWGQGQIVISASYYHYFGQ